MRIFGTIRNSKNIAPVKNAIIKLSIGNVENASISSDDHGRFEHKVETECIGQTLDIVIEKDGYASKNVSYEIDKPEIQIDISLEEYEVEIKGNILIEKTNSPLESANIILKIDDDTIKKVASNKDGSFSFTVPQQYLYEFIEYEAIKDGYQTKSGKFQLKDVKDEDQLEIKLAPKEEKMRVKKDVKDEIKKPEEDARVDIEVGKDGGISFSIPSVSIPAKIALTIIAVIAVVGLALPAIQQYIQQPSLSVSPDYVNFNLGSINPGETAFRTISISNAGGRTLTWNANGDQPWIDLNPKSGTNSGTVSVSAKTADLSPGSYSGIITITSNAGTKYGTISFNIAPNSTPIPLAPKLSVSQNIFKLEPSSEGKSKVQSFQIANAGGRTLEWSISTDESWILVSPARGVNSKTVMINVDTAGLIPGSHAGIITVESNGGNEKLSVTINIPAPSPIPIVTTPIPAVTTPTPAVTTPPTPTAPVPVLTTIKVSPATVSVVVGGTQTFTAATLDQFNNTIATTVTWSSSSTAFGTIDSAGRFTAKASGTTTITAASGSISGTATVTTPTPSWSSSSWVGVETNGINSHQPGSAWCPEGSFITAIDLDADSNLNAWDSPVIGQARCSKLSGAENNVWSSSDWYKVEQQGINSHQPGSAWCPEGSFITAIDLDADSNLNAWDSPVIGQVQCSKLAGSQYGQWVSSYWIAVGEVKSHQASEPWCKDGSFLTQFDLDSLGTEYDAHDSPIVGQAKCSYPYP